jgi:hypothetical protein
MITLTPMLLMLMLMLSRLGHDHLSERPRCGTAE